jgi:threonine dehydrogenase-like Zn-dependent dehydrogenase
MEETVGLALDTASPTQPIWSQDRTMLALTYQGAGSVKLQSHAFPMMSDPRDAIVRIQACTICGSDLHLFHGRIPETSYGDILGHESIGVVEDIGPNVKHISRGDHVVVSAVIGCGQCQYCNMGRFSNCANTNSSYVMKKMYGHKTAGLFGYSHLTGGYPGLQAEYARIPFADVNLFKYDPTRLSAENALLLSDVACTAYQSVLYGEVGVDKYHRQVAVWGCGPIGLTAGYLASRLFGANVVIIDSVDERLNIARSKGLRTINFKSEKTGDGLKRYFGEEGPDVAIDATGFRYATSIKHRLETGMYLETDAIDALVECITFVRKSGVVSIIGDYVGWANHFPIGAIMEKGLTLRSGQLHCQSYWKDLSEKMMSGEIDLSWLFTHRFPLGEIERAYVQFDQKQVLKPFIHVSADKV